MVQHFDIFILLAELAATILGFSGVAVAFNSEALKTFGPRLINLVLSAIAALIFSLMPLPFLVDGAPNTLTTRICVSLFAVFLIAQVIFLVREMFFGARQAHQSNPFLIAPFLVWGSVVAILISRDALAPEPSWSVYTWGLYFLIVQSAYLFSRMIWLTWKERQTDVN